MCDLGDKDDRVIASPRDSESRYSGTLQYSQMPYKRDSTVMLFDIEWTCYNAVILVSLIERPVYNEPSYSENVLAYIILNVSFSGPAPSLLYPPTPHLFQDRQK